MPKSKKLNVQGNEITIIENRGKEYISLTDMLKAKDGDFFISDWLRNRNTVEYLGIWESVYNPSFNYGEFAIIKSQAGLNSYKISVKEWVEKTNGIGLKATTGRYGGTYAHPDIAFEFGMWISPPSKTHSLNTTDLRASNIITAKVSTSESTRVSQMPRSPKKVGKMSIPIPMNTTPRKVVITIDPKALPIEVKKLVTKMLNPFIKKTYEKICNP